MPEPGRARDWGSRAWRTTVLAAVLGVCGGLGWTAAIPPRPMLIWNASASVPRGLYAVTRIGRPAPGDMVVARLPRRWRAMAARRGYLPIGVPLVKRVAAVAGERVCAKGAQVRIGGRVAARRLSRDARGRTLPWWRGCVTLRPGEVFLLSPAPDSFDGRYFGPVSREDLVGKAWPLVTF